VDPGGGARPVRPGLATALLLVGGCARPAERDETAAPTTAPSTTTPPTTVQDSEALRRTQLEVERFCMTKFPDHCAGVSLVMGQAATAIKVEPVGKQPTPRDLAAFRKKLEQLAGERMTDRERGPGGHPGCPPRPRAAPAAVRQCRDRHRRA
jgi:hypothetical protein